MGQSLHGKRSHQVSAASGRTSQEHVPSVFTSGVLLACGQSISVFSTIPFFAGPNHAAEYVKALPFPPTGANSWISFRYIPPFTQDDRANSYSLPPLRPNVRIGNDYIESVVSIPDTTSVVCASADDNIHIWDFGTNRPQAVLRGHRQPVRDVALFSDSPSQFSALLLASCSYDKTIRLWEIQEESDSFDPSCVALLGGDLHGGPVLCLSSCEEVWPNWLFSGADNDCTVRVWDVRQKGRRPSDQLGEFPLSDARKAQCLDLMPKHSSATGTLVVGSYSSKPLQLFDPRTFEQVGALDDSSYLDVRSVCCLRDRDEHIAVGSLSSTMVFDVRQLSARAGPVFRHGEGARSVVEIEDSGYIVWVNGDSLWAKKHDDSDGSSFESMRFYFAEVNRLTNLCYVPALDEFGARWRRGVAMILEFRERMEMIFQGIQMFEGTEVRIPPSLIVLGRIS